MWLSIIEILMNISKISIKLTGPENLKFRMDVVRTGVVASQFMLVLSAMTVDRACYVILNLKYRSSWMPDAPRWVLLIACILSCVVTTVLYLLFDTAQSFTYAKDVYYWPITDFVVVLTFIVSYALINVNVKRRARSLQRKQSVILRRKVSQVTKVPQLIVTCFITFWVTSNLIYMVFAKLQKKVPLLLAGVLNICICVSYSLDAIFYIYFCRPIRKHLKKKISVLLKKYYVEENITEDSSMGDETEQGNIGSDVKKNNHENGRGAIENFHEI
ncbi:MAG: G-protein coupled receptor, partial [Cyanobacteria bacterium J06649_11]